MPENQIGLHVYSIRMRKKRSPRPIQFDKKGDGARLSITAPAFLAAFSDPINTATGLPRAWYFDKITTSGFASSGLILYGSSGYESDIVDGRTRGLQYRKQTTDMDVIPIYFRFWFPDFGEFGLVALQTFGQRSCVNRVTSQLEAFFRKSNDGYLTELKPVYLGDLKSFQEGQVKSISLLKREFSTDSAQNAMIGPNELVDLNVSFRAKRKRNLGRLGDLMKRIVESDRTEALTYDDHQFDEATAFVRVGGRNRKIVLLGVSQDMGKIDLSDDVTRQPNGHPKFDSIDAHTEEIFSDIVAGLQ